MINIRIPEITKQMFDRQIEEDGDLGITVDKTIRELAEIFAWAKTPTPGSLVSKEKLPADKTVRPFRICL